ncbi:MFS transporter [Flavisolibacter ginsengisoli]|jgi:FSR family fosmidomycin resistance protein-like MFS transporter|uniref:MFS transporter, FSR family, fosmidomycin resistance protein n=1 Tax=Flavisolibacter ginsengisoli DSM 18119 TaxID=1121884 RepID=A0A1M4ZHN1_9BACT|nr:MFS transporter [Flavisolibacter ginsengisoli]SHF17317.1 MFS transporter, FSR family, fosmidomycin resistance protein [Flavisolibacter ginsengisoli DSM 18119]
MEQRSAQQALNPIQSIAGATVFPVLLSISFSHLLNDTIQSLIPSIYPLVKASFHLSFSQVGLITLTFQLAASLLQPFVGYYTDKRPQPFSLATGMGFTLAGLILLSFAPSFHWLLLSVAMIGIGSSVFHPEASKVAYMASGGRRGLAQSIFQVGGNAGSSMGPLLAALVVVRYGQSHIAWFSILALTAIVVLIRIGKWYQQNIHRIRPKSKGTVINFHPEIPRRTVGISIAILLVLIFSKYFYLACMSSYFTFFLIDKFKLSIQSSQVHLFLFLFSTAAGTFLGGPLGDRFGRKYVIWFSILGVAPFTILLPFMDLFWTTVFSICIGFILSSAFSAILVYAQELLPGKIGMVSGLFFGFAFGMGGLGSAVLGALADHTSIHYIFQLCGFLPLIGLLTSFLPDLKKKHPQIVT